MIQSKEDIEKEAEIPDHWGYRDNPEDMRRKSFIVGVARMFEPFNSALDIGCHEGFITKDLPARELYGYEISDNSAARLPKNVSRLNENEITNSYGFDLVVATGVLYDHYFWENIVYLINSAMPKIVITSNIKDWENPLAPRKINGKEIFTAEFPYREYIQKLRVFQT